MVRSPRYGILAMPAEPKRTPSSSSCCAGEPFGGCFAVKIVDVGARYRICEVAGHLVPSPFNRCPSRETSHATGCASVILLTGGE
jgi:hypothetical protein